MAIKPIDMQVMMPKVHEIAKINSEEQQRNQGMLQKQADSTQKHARENTNTVHTQDNAQKAAIREREQEKKRKQQKQERDKDKEESKKVT